MCMTIFSALISLKRLSPSNEGMRMDTLSGFPESMPARRPSPFPTTMAPLPSPNSTQDARSFQSTSLDIASADTMSILSALPVEMRESASSMQYRTPTHAALTSNAGAAMPSFSATQNANEGVTVSPRMVAASTNPISEGEVFASSRAISAEPTARSSSVSSVRTCLFRMPVRV